MAGSVITAPTRRCSICSIRAAAPGRFRTSHAEIESIGNAGHYPMEETPVWLATRLEAFIGAER